MNTVSSGLTVAPGRPRRFFARRFAAVLLLGTVAGAALSSCAAVKPEAVRLGDFSLSTKEFEAELELSAKNTALTQQIGGALVSGAKADSKKWRAEFVAETLNNLLLTKAIQAEFAEKKLKAKTLAPDVQKQVMDQFGGATEFAKLPKEFRERQMTLSPQVEALINAEVATLGTPEEYFEKNKATLAGTVCASHILVPTLEEALAAKERIDGGEDFATVANELTQDPGGRDKGGELGCTAPSSYVPEFAEAVSTLEIGQLGGPVQTQFGFHLIKVTSREAPSFEQAKAQITTELEQRGSLLAQKAVFGRLTPETVSVNPALGSIDTSTEFLRIVAPKTKVGPKSTTAPTLPVQP